MAWIAGKILQAAADLAGHEPSIGVDVDSIANHTGLTTRQVSHSCSILTDLGLMARIQVGRYQITPNGIIAMKEGRPVKSGPKNAVPRADTRGLRKLAWRAIRMEKKFTLPELQGLICTGEEKDANSNLLKFVRFLVKAGYLIVLPRKAASSLPTSNGLNRYFLDETMDTGPLAPVYRQKTGEAFDPNTQKVWALKSEDENGRRDSA